MTLFEIIVFVDGIKAKRNHPKLGVCPKCHDKYTYKRQKRKRNTETHREIQRGRPCDDWGDATINQGTLGITGSH